jgi:hypothetical protein
MTTDPVRRLGSSISIETRLDNRGSIPGRGNNGTFLFATALRPVLGPIQPPIQRVWAVELFSWGVKRPGRETDHSPSSGAKVKLA